MKSTFKVWLQAVTAALAVAFAISGAGLVTSGVASAQVRAALIRDMDSPIRGTRFSVEETFNFDTGDFFISDTITPAVPAGKKLFLQTVSTHTFLTDGQSVMEARLTVNPGGSPQFYVDQDFQAQSSSINPQRHFTGNRDLNILLAPGETINVFLFRNDNAGSSGLNFARISLIGYLVDANP